MDATQDLSMMDVVSSEEKYANEGKQIIGSVLGIEVRDKFFCRVELNIVGLHRQIEDGIDYAKQKEIIIIITITYANDDDKINHATEVHWIACA
ncbi:unnamed protein product [Dovyalis caffra]|uniref:YDG domain-containing protein n=1 Tax=Dovyalis caffra TaxID=77055 RepID=A0AAV1SR04_9ROSI|nr:unnamed protein product [Dovyalis caffra]